jgi:hypothetical protein
MKIKTIVSNNVPTVDKIQSENPGKGVQVITINVDGQVKSQAAGFTGAACKEHPVAVYLNNKEGVQIHDIEEGCIVNETNENTLTE